MPKRLPARCAIRTSAGSCSTRVERAVPSRSCWPYVDLLQLAAIRAHQRRDALVLGCGGGALMKRLAELHPRISIDVVEADARVVELARLHFALLEIPRLRTHVADAYAFVDRAPDAHWDLLAVDVYDDRTVDRALGSASFFRSAARVFGPGGALAVNVIASLDGPDATPLREAIDAMTKHFSRVQLVPVMEADERPVVLDATRNVVLTGVRA